MAQNSKELTRISKRIALILRHKPESAGLTLDAHGWCDVKSLCKALSISMSTLEEIVANDEKTRYSFNDSKTKIRANQGHSINVDVELKKADPPAILYHGTGEKFVDSIEKQGLFPKSRLYVHLSKDIGTATKVGSRHGKPVVYEVDTAKMQEDGIEFFISENGVWLTKSVPREYLQRRFDI